jgi:hypothetical protein
LKHSLDAMPLAKPAPPKIAAPHDFIRGSEYFN